MIPGSERNPVADCAVVVQGWREVDACVRIRSQQPGARIADAAHDLPVGSVVRRIVPSTVGGVRSGNGNTKLCTDIIVRQIVNLSAWQLKINKRRDQRSDGTNRQARIFIDRRQDRRASIVQHGSVVNIRDHNRRSFRRSAECGRAAVQRGTDLRSGRATGLIPGSESEIRIRSVFELWQETNQVGAAQQQSRRVCDGSNIQPRAAPIERILPFAKAAVQTGDRDPFDSSGINVGHSVATGVGDNRRNGITAVTGVVFRDRGERHGTRIVKHRSIVDRGNGDHGHFNLCAERSGTASDRHIDLRAKGSGGLIPGMKQHGARITADSIGDET